MRILQPIDVHNSSADGDDKRIVDDALSCCDHYVAVDDSSGAVEELLVGSLGDDLDERRKLTWTNILAAEEIVRSLAVVRIGRR